VSGSFLLFVTGITPEKNAGEERQWRYRRGEFRQDHGKILRKRTPVALQERRIPAGSRQDSPQKNAGGVTGEENSGRITARFSAKERRWRYRRGEFRQDYGKILRKRTPVALQERRIPARSRRLQSIFRNSYQFVSFRIFVRYRQIFVRFRENNGANPTPSAACGGCKRLLSVVQSGHERNQ